MASQDTEITLGMGKLLGLFFALAALCAVFLGLGYSLGKSSVKDANTATVSDATTLSAKTPGAPKPAGSRAAGENKPAMTFYKAVEQSEPDSKLAAPEAETTTAHAADPMTPKSPAPEMAHSGSGGYIVQVAAVSKQEDAAALADALKKKSYAVIIATNPSNDKLFHVQVGPFADIAEAETMRNRLVTDGYNPILKK
jgi:DedD protein